MTLSGWIIMITSIISVTFFFLWCIYKILITPDEMDHIHGFEIKTPDQEPFRKDSEDKRYRS